MVIAVTGGHGFLGSEITQQARARGDDALPLGRPDEKIPSPEFSTRLAEAAPELLVHAAGPASVAASVDDPGADRAGSVDVLKAVLAGVAELPRPPRVVLISSAAVYGQPERLPVTEEEALEPLSPYGRHRVECEALLNAHGQATGAPVLAMRVFSAYGEGLRRQLLWDISQLAFDHEVVSLGGTGEETRDFVHVSDVAGAVLLAAARPSWGQPCLNVASGTETTIRDLASGLLAALDLPGRSLSFSGQARAGDPARWRADVERLRSLGFSPGVSLEDGLRRYAAWARSVAQPTARG